MKHRTVSLALVSLFLVTGGSAVVSENELEEEQGTRHEADGYALRPDTPRSVPGVIAPAPDSCPHGSVGQRCRHPDGWCPPGSVCDKFTHSCCRNPPVCPHGPPGPFCPDSKGCRPGHHCINRRCCSLCPAWDMGALCSTKKCKPGYDCRNGLCCRNHCPAEIGIAGPPCSPLYPCKPGYTCRSGTCCAECPKGMTLGGQCNLTPGQTRCSFGYDCINNMLCCAPEKT